MRMLLPHTSFIRFRSVRLLHCSPIRCDLIGPPDPISHIRPVIYDGPTAPHKPKLSSTHPFSLYEFDDCPPSDIDESLNDMEFQWKLQREQLDIFHQDFWTDVSPSRILLRSPLFIDATEQHTIRDSKTKRPLGSSRDVHSTG